MKENPSYGTKLPKVGVFHVGVQKYSTSRNDRVTLTSSIAFQCFNVWAAVTSGTPMEFFEAVRKFGARRKIQADDPVSLGETWGLPPRIWHEEWSQASGGEGQRAMLAVAVCLKPDILLLDEPTSYYAPVLTVGSC